MVHFPCSYIAITLEAVTTRIDHDICTFLCLISYSQIHCIHVHTHVHTHTHAYVHTDTHIITLTATMTQCTSLTSVMPISGVHQESDSRVATALICLAVIVVLVHVVGGVVFAAIKLRRRARRRTETLPPWPQSIRV